ncbi:hypothetical protein SPRG_14399 [Saprolegnia parasitica CBS 223.65]|uniref:Beta-lactamase-related domain-containing protein n=1 Tax=Saprolegnia parasitica (strain CBS 223.65) TaxID=695850 RepID=A0A067BPT9_SAPPC|nr:hypothetical protein SPRG_14399 [Saprolegnia parasitica CBS 223.65]KDO20263.1 hypothetical protein SPRG_14399 [Saprolegnia parasitica CBS 223.65]|eukprot:XP_012209003.1 hypothetical protein SPRG_14399 [Saprolegnia parasitica CBS 223.65]
MRWMYVAAILLLQLAHARLIVDWPQKRSLDEKKAMAIAFVEDQLQQHAVPGFALSIVYQNETVLTRGFGTKQYGNDSNVVTENTQFQIGSFTKTFIALGIAKLVDEGRLSWDDPVKLRLPWFELVDKYAEKYTTLGDLAAMNSVFGAYEGDIALNLALYLDEQTLVRTLRSFQTTRHLRPGYAYANLNFVILGQVIAHQTNTTWAQYLDETLFKPLGMVNTYASVPDVPSNGDLSFGHVICNGKVAGPYHLRSSPEIALGYKNGRDASGSIISTAADLAIFSKFLLLKDDGIFRSPTTIGAMITGHTIAPMAASKAKVLGYAYAPDGSAMTAGYGFDVTSAVMFGHHYFDKGGDMIAFKTRNGFLPKEQLGIVLLANAEAQDGPFEDAVLSDRMRTYLAGIFLDIPERTLVTGLEEATAAANALRPPSPCNARVFGGASWAELSDPIPVAAQNALIGSYAATISTEYYGNLTISRGQNSALQLQYGAYSAPVYFARNSATTLLWALDAMSTGGLSFPVDGLNTSTPTLFVDDGLVFTKLSYS